ncbi:MAG: hypothetical protein IJX52_07580 [Oscillibacter sp.]|nr:hypothetical protein [Oscillibacter sp.]
MAEFDDKLNSILSDPNAMAQIMQLAQSFGGGGDTTASAPPPPVQKTESAFNPLGALGGMDPGLLIKLLPLVQELGGSQDSNARRLLYALSPYLKPERQAKVDRALQLARLFHVGRQFLTKWEG